VGLLLANWIEWSEVFFIDFSFVFLVLSLFFVINRLRVGPSLADRVVALDLFATILLTATVVASFYLNNPIYSDVAIILGLVSFVGTVVFARFLEGQSDD
jgi:multicomponent Na+:H+ antiporter subunit F